MTKLEAWKAWCESAGTPDLATEFTLEQSSHGKAFSFAWERGFVDGMQRQMKSSVEKALETEKQEPVAWANSYDLQNFDMKVRTGPDLHHTVPLYTAPPKREWQGLTDEEVYECERLATVRYQRHKYSVHGQIITPADGLEWHFARAIEAKLREKNT